MLLNVWLTPSLLIVMLKSILPFISFGFHFESAISYVESIISPIKSEFSGIEISDGSCEGLAVILINESMLDVVIEAR